MFALVCVSTLLLQAQASSEPTSAVKTVQTLAEKQVITPPELVHFENAVYPADALKEGRTASVMLLLDIRADGTVAKVGIDTSGGADFDAAASAAGLLFTFKPALRNGNPIASRIKYRYAFTLSEPESAPATAPVENLNGRALSASTGETLSGVTVTITPLEGATGKAAPVLTGDDGIFTFTALPSGRYRITASAPGFDPQSVDETISDSEATDIVFRMTLAKNTAEVRVRGDRPPREVTKRTLERREISRIPGTNGDALRALQNLPGVARTPFVAGQLILRGSAAQDSGIYFDGTLVPIVYHFGGISSVVPTDLLEKMDLYPGNFAAEYGRAIGGIVEVGIREPNRDNKFHALVQLDLIQLQARLEGPIALGWRFLASARRSWFDTWLGPILARTAGANVTAAPVYYDYQLEVAHDIGSDGSFRLLFMGSDDGFKLFNNNPAAADATQLNGFQLHTAFWRLQARYQQRFSEATSVRVVAATGLDLNTFSFGQLSQEQRTYPITLRAELKQKIFSWWTINIGFDGYFAPYSYTAKLPAPPPPGTPPRSQRDAPLLTTSTKSSVIRPGFYIDAELTPWKGARIVPSLRLDYAQDTKQWDTAPRLVIRQDLPFGFSRRTTIKAGAGLFFQPPQLIETDAVFGQTGLVSNRAQQYDVGVEQEITKQLEFSVDGFYKVLDHLVVRGSQNSGAGKIYGLELLLRYKADEHFFGWISYTLSRSERRDTPDQATYLAPYDQTHILAVIASYRIGWGWEVGARFRLVSGGLTTQYIYGYEDLNAGRSLPIVQQPIGQQRLPLFHQLDIRIDKTWQFAAWQFAIYLDVQNVYNYNHPEGHVYNYNYSQQAYQTGLPILPSLGVRGEF